MNLIEQLGGYEKAKSALDWIEKNKPVHEWMKPILNAELLQYRREHGIFEVGDKVLSVEHKNSDVQIVELVDEKRIKVFSKDMYFSYWVYKFQFRHATDAEIKANKRLEVS